MEETCTVSSARHNITKLEIMRSNSGDGCVHFDRF